MKPKLELPLVIVLQKDEFDRGSFDGVTAHKGLAGKFFDYCIRKKIPVEEPRSEQGYYDTFVIKITTIEQALNILLWEKFSLLTKIAKK